MQIKSLSKRDASKYRPERPTLLISIQDGDKAELPFKQRTNHITRSRYVDCLFLYFDDIEPNTIPGKPQMPFAFSESDAKQITNFLKRHFNNKDFEDIIVHCEASPPKLRFDGASITGLAFQLLPGIDSFSHHTV